MEASKPKLVNSISNIIGVNSLRLEGLHLLLIVMNVNVQNAPILGPCEQISVGKLIGASEITGTILC